MAKESGIILVYKVLDGRYKDERYVESAKSRRTSSAITRQAVLNADVSADILAKYKPPQKQEAARRKSLEHNKLEAIILENSELRRGNNDS